MIINYDFELNHHTRIVFGTGNVKKVGSEVEKYGDKALVVTDRGLKNLGIIEAVVNSLEMENVSYATYDKVFPNPRDTGCDEAMEIGKKFEANVIIGVGGERYGHR